MSGAAPGGLVTCPDPDNGQDRNASVGLRVVWDSPVLEARERLQLEQLLTRVLHEALWELLEQRSFAHTAHREGGGDDNSA